MLALPPHLPPPPTPLTKGYLLAADENVSFLATETELV